MENIPQEIIDKIIYGLTFDFASLKSALLVHKSWTYQSRRRLFHYVPFHSLNRLERWSSFPKTTKLSRIILDANGMFPEECDMEKAERSSLDAILSEHVERISAKHPNRRLKLQFRADTEGAIGERDR